jgi:DNA-binding response OmpR family regulator
MSVVNPSSRIIFHVDDEPLTRRLVKAILEESGYTVFSYEEPEPMFATLLTTSPTAILLDVNMPKISGYDLCKQIRAKHPEMQVPIIFLTGNKTPEDLQLARSSGGDYFVIKPFSPDSLVDGISKAFQMVARTRKKAAEN